MNLNKLTNRGGLEATRLTFLPFECLFSPGFEQNPFKLWFSRPCFNVIRASLEPHGWGVKGGGVLCDDSLQPSPPLSRAATQVPSAMRLILVPQKNSGRRVCKWSTIMPPLIGSQLLFLSFTAGLGGGGVTFPMKGQKMMGKTLHFWKTHCSNSHRAGCPVL